jgi:3-oxoacid CoA-transferase B subunit
MDYRENKEIIALRIARLFQHGDVVNLGIGLPTLVGDFIPAVAGVVLQSENGLMGLGPAAAAGAGDKDLTNAGGAPVTLLAGGCYFDSATSFGIIRGGHVDYTVLGVLEVDQQGNLANYTVPGKRVPGMGGAMDLTAGARVVIAATLHFEPSGASRLKRRCALPLTTAGRVDLVVTDLGVFQVRDDRFRLVECLGPHPPDWVRAHTDADLEIAADCPRLGPEQLLDHARPLVYPALS